MNFECASVTSSLCSRLSYLASIMLSLSLEQWAIVVGMVTAIGTFFVNWYYKRQHLKLSRNYNHSWGDECE